MTEDVYVLTTGMSESGRCEVLGVFLTLEGAQAIAAECGGRWPFGPWYKEGGHGWKWLRAKEDGHWQRIRRMELEP